MEKLPLLITNGYRIFVSALLIYLIIQEQTVSGLTIKTWFTAIGILAYTLVFSLFNNSKPFQFIDWLIILIATNYTGNYFILAFAVPTFINVVSKNKMFISSAYLSLSTLVISMYFKIEFWSAITISFAVAVATVLFSLNFVKISLLDIKNNTLREEIENLRVSNSVKNNQIETVSKLFIHNQNLEKIRTIEELTSQILASSQDYFNSYYVCLYLYKNGEFLKTGEKGDKQKYNSTSVLDADTGRTPFYDRNNLRVPMVYENDTWGCVSIYGKRSRLGEDGKMIFFPFEEADFEILSIYLDSAMSRLKEIRRNEQLKKAALYDRLTNLPNRTYLEGEIFDSFVRKFKREHKQFSILLLDIDHFKSFNDTFGHLVGDEVLKVVAHILSDTCNSLGKVDKVGRWGGEEFIGFLSGTPEECYKKAELIRKAIESYNFSYRAITVSSGLSCYEYHGRELVQLTKNADLALYSSKENGRNRVTMYSERGY